VFNSIIILLFTVSNQIKKYLLSELDDFIFYRLDSIKQPSNLLVTVKINNFIVQIMTLKNITIAR